MTIEVPLVPPMAAIANAIYDAIGVRMDHLPFTPPNVWRAIQDAREAGTLRKPTAPGAVIPEQTSVETIQPVQAD